MVTKDQEEGAAAVIVDVWGCLFKWYLLNDEVLKHVTEQC